MSREKAFVDTAKAKILDIESREMPDGSRFGNPANLVCFAIGRSCGIWRDGRALFPSKTSGETALEELLSELFALIEAVGVEKAISEGISKTRFWFGGFLGRNKHELERVIKEALETLKE